MHLKDVLRLKIAQARKHKAPYVKMTLSELEEIHKHLETEHKLLQQKDQEIVDLKNTQTVLHIEKPSENSTPRHIDGGGFK